MSLAGHTTPAVLVTSSVSLHLQLDTHVCMKSVLSHGMSECCKAEGWPDCWVADVCLLEQAIAAGDMGAARAAAGHGQAEGSADALGAPQASAEEAAAVVPSISARPPAEAAEEGSLTARVQNDQLSSHDSGEEAASRPQKRAHLRLES